MNAPRRTAGGFTLVEVVVSLTILAVALIPLLTALGGSAEKALDTKLHRMMRYLAGLQVADIELQKILPDPEQDERYEEGMTGDFNDFSSSDDAEEYRGFEFSIDRYREEIIVGGEDPESLEQKGFEVDRSGNVLGRPVSNDNPAGLGGGGESEEEPEGQMKRLLVLTIRKVGETAEEDLEFRVMTYLPMPDEGGGGEGEGAAEGGAPGEGAAGAEGKGQPAGGSAGGDRK